MIRKLLSALFVLGICTILLCSCNTKINIEDFNIVYSESDGDIIKASAGKIKEAYPQIIIAGDTSAYQSSEKEILIGNTNRIETQIVSKSLLNLDYSISFTDNKIVICGGSVQATENAVAYFLENCISEGKITSKDYTYKHEYAVNSICVDNTKINSFNVITCATDSSYDDFKSLFSKKLTDASGLKLKEIADSLNIMIKCDPTLEPNAYLIKVSTGDITLAGSNSYSLSAAIDAFFNTILTTDTKFSNGDEFRGTIPKQSVNYSDCLNQRTPLYNTYYKLTNEKKLNVVYFGSSVTSGYGASDPEATSWRALTGKWFEDTFPYAKINNYNSCISASGTMLGAFRCSHDVCALDPDLVFIELSINDVYCSTEYNESILYYESIVRQIRENSPDCDIVAIYVSDQTHLRENPTVLYEQALGAEKVAIHYNLPSVNLSSAVSSTFDYTDDTQWFNYFIDIVHPSDSGYEIYFNVIKEFLEAQLVYGDAYSLQPIIPELGPKLCETDFSPKMYFVNELDILLNTNFSVSEESYWKTANPYPGYLYPTAADNLIVLSFSGNNAALFAEYGSENRLIYTLDSEHDRIQNQRGYHPLFLAEAISENQEEHLLNLSVRIRNPDNPYIITALLTW